MCFNVLIFVYLHDSKFCKHEISCLKHIYNYNMNVIKSKIKTNFKWNFRTSLSLQKQIFSLFNPTNPCWSLFTTGSAYSGHPTERRIHPDAAQPPTRLFPPKNGIQRCRNHTKPYSKTHGQLVIWRRSDRFVAAPASFQLGLTWWCSQLAIPRPIDAVTGHLPARTGSDCSYFVRHRRATAGPPTTMVVLFEIRTS